MSIEVMYLLRNDEPGPVLRDLDDVVVLSDVVTDDGASIAAGTEGTVVGVWEGGRAYIVEFAEPMGALATIDAGSVKRIGRSAT